MQNHTIKEKLIKINRWKGIKLTDAHKKGIKHWS